VAEVQPMVVRQAVARGPSTYGGGSTVVRRTSSVPPSQTSILRHRLPSPSPSELLLFTSTPPSSSTSLITTHGRTATLPSDLQARNTAQIDHSSVINKNVLVLKYIDYIENFGRFLF